MSKKSVFGSTNSEPQKIILCQNDTIGEQNGAQRVRCQSCKNG
jgi:hypothetical protein